MKGGPDSQKPTADYLEKEAGGRDVNTKKKTKKKTLTAVKNRRAACTIHSPPSICPIPLFASLHSTVVHLRLGVSLTFTLAMRCVKEVNPHTPGLHSTLMLSHDKLLTLSLISNLLLLLLPSLCLSVFHTKWACFPRSHSTAVEYKHAAQTLWLSHKVCRH